MKPSYISALASRHASIQRQIEEEEKSPRPDTILIMRLKKIRLQYRDRMKEAITSHRLALSKNKRAQLRRSFSSVARSGQPQSNGSA